MILVYKAARCRDKVISKGIETSAFHSNLAQGRYMKSPLLYSLSQLLDPVTNQEVHTPNKLPINETCLLMS
jgi:hypothetical protein